MTTRPGSRTARKRQNGASSPGRRAPRPGQLERVRERLQAVLQGILWEADADTLQFTYVSNSAVDVLGYSIEEWTGSETFWADHLHPDDRERTARALRRAVSKGEDLRMDYRMIAAGGRVVWLRDHAFLVDPEERRDGRGDIRGFMVNVTESKRTEQRLKAQYNVSRTLAEFATIEEAAPHILRDIGESLSLQVGNFWLIPEGDALRLLETWITLPARAAGPLLEATRELALHRGEGLPGHVVRTGLPVWMTDLASEPSFSIRRPHAEQAGLRSGFGFPIRLGDQLLGVMEFLSQAPLDPEPDLIEALSAIGHQIGQFIERKRAEQAASDREIQYRDLIEGLGVAVYTTDAQGRITLFNDEAVDLWGRTPELGKDLWCGSWRLYHPDGSPMQHGECPMAMTLKENRAVRDAEIIAERPDGSRRTIVPYPTPLRNSAGNLVGAVNVLVDITDRKRAESLLRLSELRYKSLFEGNIDAVFSFDLSGCFTSANPACETVSGYTPDELIGMPFTDLVVKDDLTKAMDRFLAVLQGEPQNVEVSITHKEGRLARLNVTGIPITVDGKTTGVFGIAKDVTESRQQEDALRESESRLTLALQAGRMGAWEWNIQTGAVHWSEALERIHGLPPGSFAGTFEAYCSDVHPDDLDNLIQNIDASVHTGEHDVEYRIILPGGETRWVSGKGQVVRDESGTPMRMIGVCMDITERKHAEDALRAALEAKDEFLGMISHELRTPITTIYGGARLLRFRASELDAESTTSVVEDIEHETDRLHRIVEDLLVLSRLGLDKKVATEPVLIQHLIERAAEAFRRRMRPVDVEVAPDLAPVAGEPTYLEQVLRNLLSNADKYSPAGLTIEIHAQQAGGELVVSIVDHGPGIGAEERDRIFERFYRSSNARAVGGAGIGLTVCKRLIDAQSGRIWADAGDDGGLKVSFALPRFREEPA